MHINTKLHAKLCLHSCYNFSLVLQLCSHSNAHNFFMYIIIEEISYYRVQCLRLSLLNKEHNWTKLNLTWLRVQNQVLLLILAIIFTARSDDENDLSYHIWLPVKRRTSQSNFKHCSNFKPICGRVFGKLRGQSNIGRL